MIEIEFSITYYEAFCYFLIGIATLLLFFALGQVACLRYQSKRTHWKAANYRKLLSLDQTIPLPDALSKLSYAADILFDRYDYDDEGWEKIDAARKSVPDTLKRLHEAVHDLRQDEERYDDVSRSYDQ